MEKFYNYWLPTITMLIISILYVALSYRFTKDKDESKKMLPVKIVWIFLLVFEIGKIGHMIATNKTDGIVNPSFVPLRYPLVFCSIILYTYPLFVFKKNKLSDLAMGMSVLPALFAFIAAVVTTTGYKLNFWHAHSIVFHFLMGAVAIYLIVSGLYKFEFKNYFEVFVGLSVYIIFAAFLSLFTGGEISILGPKSGNLAFLYNAFGYMTGNLVLLFAIYLLLLLIYFLVNVFRRKKPQTKSEDFVLNDLEVEKNA